TSSASSIPSTPPPSPRAADSAGPRCNPDDAAGRPRHLRAGATPRRHPPAFPPAAPCRPARPHTLRPGLPAGDHRRLLPHLHRRRQPVPGMSPSLANLAHPLTEPASMTTTQKIIQADISTTRALVESLNLRPAAAHFYLNQA